MSPEDYGLLDELVDWWDLFARPYKMNEERAYEDLVASGHVAYAPEGHVYPLPRGVNFMHRSRPRRPRKDS